MGHPALNDGDRRGHHLKGLTGRCRRRVRLDAYHPHIQAKHPQAGLYQGLLGSCCKRPDPARTRWPRDVESGQQQGRWPWPATCSSSALPITRMLLCTAGKHHAFDQHVGAAACPAAASSGSDHTAARQYPHTGVVGHAPEARAGRWPSGQATSPAMSARSVRGVRRPRSACRLPESEPSPCSPIVPRAPCWQRPCWPPVTPQGPTVLTPRGAQHRERVVLADPPDEWRIARRSTCAGPLVASRDHARNTPVDNQRGASQPYPTASGPRSAAEDGAPRPQLDGRGPTAVAAPP